MSDSRHRQLSRIYQRPIEDDENARAAISAEPGVLASALFLEAVESDDVTSAEAARRYLDDRVAFFRELVEGASDDIKVLFEAKVRAWE